MTIIADVLDRDPRQNRLINNGQARIGSDDIETRGELTSFVCEGRYSDGIVRIVESFTRDIGKSSQQAAWVSGFYGSGKSHLIKMLTYLWENKPFSDGVTPVQLIPDLPDDVRAALKELDQEATRAGGAFAAAGSMLSGQAERPRYSVLSIMLKAAGLPGDFGQARFMLFLKDRNIEAKVRAEIEARGGTLEQEVEDLFVSPLIADALLKIDTTLGSTNKDVRDAIRAQFRTPDFDISKDQFTDVVRRVLRLRSRNDKMPLTLVVLDEVQIYIGDGNDSQDRAGAIAEIAETFAKEFGSRVMLVGAGQSALNGVPQLVRLLDRFTIRIQLDDSDVETVTRKVLLRKKAGERDNVSKALDANAAAISRQLQSTRVAERPEDRAIRIDDYPLLPVRRRFWEVCFRALDRQGTQAQLRSQLRILHDALGDVASQPLGFSVAGDVLYDALKAALVQSGDLPRDTYERIESLATAYSADGALPKRHRRAGIPDFKATARDGRRHRRASDARTPGRSARRRPDGGSRRLSRPGARFGAAHGRSGRPRVHRPGSSHPDRRRARLGGSTSASIAALTSTISPRSATSATRLIAEIRDANSPPGFDGARRRQGPAQADTASRRPGSSAGRAQCAALDSHRLERGGKGCPRHGPRIGLG